MSDLLYDRWCEAETDALDAYYESLATVIDEGDWYWWTE